MEIGVGEPELALESEAINAPRRGSLRRRYRIGTARRERRDAIARRALALGDLIAILIGALAAGALGAVRDPWWELAAVTLPTVPLWLVLIKLYGLYERDAKRISHSSLDDLPALFHALVIGTLFLWGYTKLIPISQLTFAEAAAFGAVGVICGVMLRTGMRKAIPRFLGPERVLLAGGGPTVAPLVRKIEQHPEYGLEVAGLLSAHGHRATNGSAVRIVGEVGDLAPAVEATQAHRIVICKPALEGTDVLEIIEACRRLSVKVSILPDAVDALGPSTEIDEVEGVTLLGVKPRS